MLGNELRAVVQTTRFGGPITPPNRGAPPAPPPGRRLGSPAPWLYRMPYTSMSCNCDVLSRGSPQPRDYLSIPDPLTDPKVARGSYMITGVEHAGQ